MGIAEQGSFLHVAGLKYKVNTAIPCTAQYNELEIWTGRPTGEYRGYDVQVYNKDTDTWDALDLNASYNLAGYNYTIRDLGGGFDMLPGAVNVLDYVMEDYMVLANYVSAFENSTIRANNSPLSAKYKNLHIDYSSVYGDGRIVLTENVSETIPTESPATGDSGVLCAVVVILSSAMAIIVRRRRVR